MVVAVCGCGLRGRPRKCRELNGIHGAAVVQSHAQFGMIQVQRASPGCSAGSGELARQLLANALQVPRIPRTTCVMAKVAEYLSSCRAVLGNATKFDVVMGNQACDADSIVSSIVFGCFLQTKQVGLSFHN